MFQLLGVAAGGLALAALTVFYGTRGLFRYFRDVGSHIRNLSADDPEATLRAIDRVNALADIVLLAVVADRQVTPEEWGAVERLLASGHGGEAGPPSAEQLAEVRNRMALLARRLHDDAHLSIELARVAARVATEDREIAYRMVVEATRAGARLPSESAAAYREGPDAGGVRLRGLFMQALGIGVERQRVLDAEGIGEPKD